MDYELTAISDTDASWNPVMEAWWNNGGALLWNRYGGFGKNKLTLIEEEMNSFLQAAGEITGWRTCDCQEYGVALGNPVIVRPYSADESPPQQDENHADEHHDWCCRDCGRPLHEALAPEAFIETIMVSRRDLNHVLNSLQEAIDFSRAKGPNNNLTWEAALETFVASLK